MRRCFPGHGAVSALGHDIARLGNQCGAAGEEARDLPKQESLALQARVALQAAGSELPRLRQLHAGWTPRGCVQSTLIRDTNVYLLFHAFLPHEDAW